MLPKEKKQGNQSRSQVSESQQRASTSRGASFDYNQSMPNLSQQHPGSRFSRSSPGNLHASTSMPLRWSVNEEQPRKEFEKTPTQRINGMRRYYDWRRYILMNNKHPLIALKELGVKNSDYKLTNQKESRRVYSLRLNISERLVFEIDEVNKELTIISIGKHD